MPLYVVTWNNSSSMTLVDAKDESVAVSAVESSFGSDAGPYVARSATNEDAKIFTRLHGGPWKVDA